MAGDALSVERVEVAFGPTTVLKGVSLAVAPGEFVALLGSSGCGKTTLLRAISGFVCVGAGRVLVAGRDITALPPERRGMAMVFQSYALWPHMSTAQNIGSMWVATSAGRVFITDNANAPAASVVWNRVDPNPANGNTPSRAISAIHIDAANPHRAWISYNGYNVNTPAQPGHVFEVTWGGAGAAVWVDRSYNLPDFPITALVRDDVTGDLYAGSDFGVMKLKNGETTWTVAGTGLPNVEICGLTIVSDARILYAATHGRSAWSLALP